MIIRPIAKYQLTCGVCGKPAVTCQPVAVVQMPPEWVRAAPAVRKLKPVFAPARGVQFRCRKHADMPQLQDAADLSRWAADKGRDDTEGFDGA